MNDYLSFLKSLTESFPDNDLLEKLASLEHDQWVEWTKDLAEKETISQDRKNRWKKLWIPYEELSEEKKEEDRKYARKVLKILPKD